MATLRVTVRRQRRWQNMRAIRAICSTTLGLVTSLLLIFSGCVGVRDREPAAVQDRSDPAQPVADLYVGQGRGGCIGLYLRNGVVTGGYVVTPQRDSAGESLVWPILVLRQLDEDTCLVDSLGGAVPEFGRFNLTVTEVDELALFYRVAAIEAPHGIAYSGTATNVDGMIRKMGQAALREYRR